MSSFRVRPRFEHIVPLDPATTQRRITENIDPEIHRCEVKNFPGYLALRIPESDHHFWSPRLTLSIDPVGDGKTRISGIYGPNANVWSLFLYGYLITGSIAVFAGCIGLAQHLIGQTPWGLWILWVSLAAIAALYITAQFGQKIGARQTFLLHMAYESVIGASVEIR
ncbi:MAG: hypothetical protein ACQCXQ_14195 [Verrucomicrobiales bacterium]|nr:hypothetical protein [Verrucomicrobiota bacterium JB025]